MIVESGFIVAGGLALLFAKCDWRTRMWILSNPVLMDCLIFGFLVLLHWGTFSGVMVATMGALICSGLTSAGRYVYGYVDQHNNYVPGIRDISEALAAERLSNVSLADRIKAKFKGVESKLGGSKPPSPLKPI